MWILRKFVFQEKRVLNCYILYLILITNWNEFDFLREEICDLSEKINSGFYQEISYD